MDGVLEDADHISWPDVLHFGRDVCYMNKRLLSIYKSSCGSIEPPVFGAQG
jgi:hypothetical protein